MAPAGDSHERRDAFSAFRVNICTRFNQQLRHLRMAPSDSVRERRVACTVFRIDIRA